ECLEARPRWSAEDCCRLQQDIRSGRAATCVPAIVAMLASDRDPRVQQATEILSKWDYQVEPDGAAAAIFNAFFDHWCRTVTAERLPAPAAELAAGIAGGLATSLLSGDDAGWFPR